MGERTDDGAEGATGMAGTWLGRKHAHGAQPHAEAKRVLCLDGGGIRGIIPAMLVAELEERTGRPACELFDLIAGTSTGGIIAMGLVLAGPDGKPAFSAADGVRIYEERGPHIFSRDRKDLLQSLGGVLHERYHADGLMDILDEVFGDTRLSSALTDVLLASYEITRRETFLFSSREAKRNPDQDFLMHDAVRSTTAAPTYFEPHRVVDPGGHEHVFIDGAVFANSPAICAFAEIEREHFGSDMVIASIGAGSLTHRFEYDDVRDELLGPERYFRFQRELGEASDTLDNVKPENLRALKREGERLIADSSERIDDLCELLVR